MYVVAPKFVLDASDGIVTLIDEDLERFISLVLPDLDFKVSVCDWANAVGLNDNAIEKITKKRDLQNLIITDYL